MSYTPLTAPLFKGATRPSMLFGVPTEVFIKVLSPFFLAMLVLFPILKFAVILVFGLPFIIALLIMRDLTKRDNYYMQMQFLQLGENAQLTNNKVRGLKVIPPRPVRKSSLQEQFRNKDQEEDLQQNLNKSKHSKQKVKNTKKVKK